MFARIPFVRYVALLLAGILGGSLAGSPEPSVAWCLLTGCVAFTCLSMAFPGSRSLAARAGVTFSILLLGWVSATQQAIRLDRSLGSIEQNEGYLAYQVSVTGLPEKRERSIRYEAVVEKLFFPRESRDVDSKALIYLSPDLDFSPSAGDRLIISGKLRRPPQAGSPIGFDYRKFLERKGIPWIGTATGRGSIYRIPGASAGFPTGGRLTGLSIRSDSLFREYIQDDDAYGLVKAMILGRRDDISAGLNEAFTGSGTVHILSVSGLHIAIFFAVLHFILGFLSKSKWGKYLYLILMTGILAGYAVLTGLPASVQRATLMCMIWMLSRTFSRRHEPVNTLAVSAFFILLADPAAFFDVGFQLSFLAMLGIFLWTKPLSSLYRPSGRIARHFWNLSAVSVAAQLMTLPLILFYFNQFPTYFLFANLLAVDIAGLLIPASFGLLAAGVTGIEWLASFTGHIVNYLAVFINYVAELPQKLPFHLLEGLYLDIYQSLLLLVLLLIAYAIVVFRRQMAVKYAVMVAFCFSAYSSVAAVNDFKASFTRFESNGSVLIHKTRGKLYIASLDGKNAENNFNSYGIRKYMARYGSDTVLVSSSTRIIEP